MTRQRKAPRTVAEVPAELLDQWDRQTVWHAFSQMSEYEPLLIERAEGCTLYDIEGRAYLDGVSSLWCNVHGHRHPRLDAALRDQLDRVAHVTSLGMSSPTTVLLARRLTEIAPPGLSHVFFSGDGAAGVEVALKIAFQYFRQCAIPRPGKTTYVALGDAYHGDTLGSVSVSDIDRFSAVFRPLLFEVLRAPRPDLYRLPDGVTAASACDYYLGQLEQLLAAEHERVAALVIEPLVQGAAGMVVQPRGFLAGVRELTRRHNILLIADEVAVGFGRTGTMFACAQEGVTPDLLCLGKGLTAGYLPMAATLATDEVWSAFLGTYAEARTFFHGHTYAGNALAAAVALESLNLFEDEQVIAGLPPKIDRLGKQLARIARHANVGDVRQCGLMAGVELVADRQTKQPFPWQQRRGALVCDEARRRGVFLRPLGDVIVIMPPLAITLEEIDQIGQVLDQSIAAVLKK